MNEQTTPTPIIETPAPISPQPAASKGFWIGIGIVLILVAGAYAWVKLYPSAPTVTETPTMSTDVTTGWKTYTNTDLQYEFKYPPTWTIDTYGLTQLTKEVSVYPPDARPMQGYFSVVADNRSLGQVRAAFGPGLDSGATETRVTVSGRPGYLFTNSIGQYLFLPSSSAPSLGIDVSGSLPENPQILSTFKLTSTDATTGWKTYTSRQEPGLSFKYPSNWTLEQTNADGPNGEMAVLKAPKVGQSQTRIQWTAWVDGLGGGCPPERPHIVVREVRPLSNTTGLYFVRAGEAGASEKEDLMGVMDSTDYGTPKLGDTGTCLYYMLFHSKADPQRSMWLMASTIQTQDKEVVQQILESLRY